MNALTNFIQKEKLRRKSIEQSEANKQQPVTPSEEEEDLQVAAELAKQHVDWAKRRPKDYKVPY